MCIELSRACSFSAILPIFNPATPKLPNILKVLYASQKKIKMVFFVIGRLQSISDEMRAMIQFQNIIYSKIEKNLYKMQKHKLTCPHFFFILQDFLFLDFFFFSRQHQVWLLQLSSQPSSLSASFMATTLSDFRGDLIAEQQ